jgi:hypothetical protein
VSAEKLKKKETDRQKEIKDVSMTIMNAAASTRSSLLCRYTRRQNTVRERERETSQSFGRERVFFF